jgi:dihydropteroate synthase
MEFIDTLNLQMEKSQASDPRWNEGWRVRDQVWRWGDRTYMMGVLNVTPDSFSDGGQFATVAAAVDQAMAMAKAGADVLDVGGQSARPQADAISLEMELQRVVPVVEAIRQRLNLAISVDTTRAEVARAAIAAGADIINDISAGLSDAAMLPTVAALQVPVILMHMRGTPKTMQQLTQYDDVVGEIGTVLQERVQAAIAAGVAMEQIMLDPGIGFAKTVGQNVEILKRLPELKALGHPLLVGTSRKSFIGAILNQPDPLQRGWGTAASCCGAIAGGADLLRVHDVSAMVDVARMADAIWRKPTD